MAARVLPECWGHRGASAAFPENTLASFEAAMRDGAEGIESDVHVSLDDIVLMFHDPSLGRTTDGRGLIREKRACDPSLFLLATEHSRPALTRLVTCSLEFRTVSETWVGDMEHTRTIREPKQAIPTFEQTIQLLMRPENRHVKFNVSFAPQFPDGTPLAIGWSLGPRVELAAQQTKLSAVLVPDPLVTWAMFQLKSIASWTDTGTRTVVIYFPENELLTFVKTSVLFLFLTFDGNAQAYAYGNLIGVLDDPLVDVKPHNDPDRLFKLMHAIISAQDEWETTLAPRILLGLWHPKFIEPATRVLPTLRRAHIGMNPHIARQYFWDSCESFSIDFGSLSSSEGERFRKECKAAGKKLLVWTVNKREEMIEASRWGVDAILTDVTSVWLELRQQLQADFEKTSKSNSRLFLWTSLTYYYPARALAWYNQRSSLERVAGKFYVPPLVMTHA